jgi:hypothetical protein
VVSQAAKTRRSYSALPLLALAAFLGCEAVATSGLLLDRPLRVEAYRPVRVVVKRWGLYGEGLTMDEGETTVRLYCGCGASLAINSR